MFNTRDRVLRRPRTCARARTTRLRAGQRRVISSEKAFKLKHYGNEVYYAACSLLGILDNFAVNFVARKFSI